MFLNHLLSRDAEPTKAAVRTFVLSLPNLTHSFDCYFELSNDFGGEEAAYVDIFPTGKGLAKDHKKFGGIFVRIWMFGQPCTFTYGIFLGAERAEQSEPRRGVALTRSLIDTNLQIFEQEWGFTYHTWSSGNFPWAAKSSRAVARQLEQFVSFRQDAADPDSFAEIEKRIGEAVIFLDHCLNLLRPISEFGKRVIQEYYSENLPSATDGFSSTTHSSGGSNVIFFGPPGTGKSHAVKRRVGASPMFRTQFHPEYTNSDFVGSYRPVVGFEKDPSNVITAHDGMVIQRPVSYFSFVPGPLIAALECAFGSAASAEIPERVFLVIEEINRGDCAAIFGDAFQLLDRDASGRSEFGITVLPELKSYFRAKGIGYDIAGDGKLYLPANLTLLGTMNTSDQSLYPMDSAFKRRWQWVSCPIDFTQVLEYTHKARPFLDDGNKKWDWISLLERINRNIVQDRMEDKQLGPWFIKPNPDGSIAFEEFLNKCLFYLWHDVFRDEQLTDLSPFKSDGPEVFGSAQENVRQNGLAAGFKPEVLVEISGPESVTPEATNESYQETSDLAESAI